MDKQAKKKNQKEGVSVTEIYETIKDERFIQELWLDVMSDLKEKPTYIRLKNKIQDVLRSSVASYATKPENQEERLKTRTIFTDLSIMTYTIDTLISEVLHKKLKEEFKAIIVNIVDELKNKQSLSNIDEQTQSNKRMEDIEVKRGTSERIFLSERDIKKEITSPKSKEKCIEFQDKSINFLNESIIPMSISKANITFSNMTYNKSKESTSYQKHVTKYKKSSLLPIKKGSDTDHMEVSDDDAFSDCDSDHYTFGSVVSSVHTSDLSSFESDISISSEEEDGVKTKKHVPLKLANELYMNGKLSDLHKVNKKKMKKMDSSESLAVKNSNDSPSQRISGRPRKLNSKYSSDDIVCSIKKLMPQIETSNKEVKETSNSSIKNRTKDVLASEENKVKKGRSRKMLLLDIDESKKRIESIASTSKGNFEKGENKSYTSLNHSEKVKKKRRRPLKGIFEKTLTDRERKNTNVEKEANKKQEISLDIQQISDSRNHEPEVKRKKGSFQDSTVKNNMNEEEIKHSVESFSILEERLCLKDQKIIQLPSPPKSCTKSYETSDLYKPRSDFRVSFNSKGSKAVTLFSN